MNKLCAHVFVSTPLAIASFGALLADRTVEPVPIESEFPGGDTARLLVQNEAIRIHAIQTALGHFLVRTERESGEMEFLLNATNRPRIPRPVRPTFDRVTLLGVVVDDDELHALVIASTTHDTKAWNAYPEHTGEASERSGPQVMLRTFDLSHGTRIYNTTNRVRPTDASIQRVTRVDLETDPAGVLELRDGELFAFGEPVADWQ